MKIEKNLNISDEIPTSSMADVAFLLVVFFMLTMAFNATKGLDLTLPKDSPDAEIVPEESVLVEVARGGSLMVDQRPMKLSKLLEYLAPKLERNPYKPVIVHPMADSEYHFMVEVLDELRHGRTALGLASHIVVAIPTEREMEAFWQ